MSITSPPVTGGFRFLGRALLSLLMVCCVTEIACPQAPAGGSGYDVASQRLALIQPGTAIARSAPKGWSHLLLKAHSRPGAGDLDKMTPDTMRLASFLFSAVVANVQGQQVAGQTRYRLSGVAVGIGTRIGDKDVIINSDTQKKLGADLGFLARLGLGRAEARLTQVLTIARSESMTLFDSPTHVFRDGKHVAGVLRYAVLVDSKTGQLTQLVWFIAVDDQGGYHKAVDAFELMATPKIDVVILHIDGREFVAGLITEKAIALNRLPTGDKQIPIPEVLKPIASRARLSREMAREMETQLRALLAAPR